VAGLEAATADLETLELEWLMLPLRHHGRTHARLIGSLAPARIPAWLGLMPIGDIAIRSLRVISGPAKSVHAPLERHRRHQYLTIHEGGSREKTGQG